MAFVDVEESFSSTTDEQEEESKAVNEERKQPSYMKKFQKMNIKKK